MQQILDQEQEVQKLVNLLDKNVLERSQQQMDWITNFLKQVKYFRSLSVPRENYKDLLIQLSIHLKVISYKQMEPVYHFRDKVVYLYLVLSGRFGEFIPKSFQEIENQRYSEKEETVLRKYDVMGKSSYFNIEGNSVFKFSRYLDYLEVFGATQNPKQQLRPHSVFCFHNDGELARIPLDIFEEIIKNCISGMRFQIKTLERFVKDDMKIINMEQLCQGLKLNTSKKGYELFKQGDRSKFIYLIKEGIVQTFTKYYDPASKRLILSEPVNYYKGMLVGEQDTLLGQDRKQTAVCKTDCVFYPISKQRYSLFKLQDVNNLRGFEETTLPTIHLQNKILGGKYGDSEQVSPLLTIEKKKKQQDNSIELQIYQQQNVQNVQNQSLAGQEQNSQISIKGGAFQNESGMVLNSIYQNKTQNNGQVNQKQNLNDLKYKTIMENNVQILQKTNYFNPKINFKTIIPVYGQVDYNQPFTQRTFVNSQQQPQTENIFSNQNQIEQQENILQQQQQQQRYFQMFLNQYQKREKRSLSENILRKNKKIFTNKNDENKEITTYSDLQTQTNYFHENKIQKLQMNNVNMAENFKYQLQTNDPYTGITIMTRFKREMKKNIKKRKSSFTQIEKLQLQTSGLQILLNQVKQNKAGDSSPSKLQFPQKTFSAVQPSKHNMFRPNQSQYIIKEN